MAEKIEVKYGADGLVPAVVQDFYTGDVLCVAYMSEESLEITLREKRTCFFSRSRQALWRKGETSGNVQHVVSVSADCDCDALLVKVIKDGPACHTGEDSCFHRAVYGGGAQARPLTLQGLYGLLCERKRLMPPDSYTSYLFGKGREKILKKVGEECTEVVIGAMKGDDGETVFEIADLCYHVLVLMAECGITPADVQKELSARHVVDKKVKQERLK